MSMYAVSAMGWALAGFIGLALAMDRHRREISMYSSRLLVDATVMRWFGWSGLCLALLVSVGGIGPAVGTTVWIGVLALAALTVVMLLTYRPQWTMPAALMGVLIGAGAAVALLIGHPS